MRDLLTKNDSLPLKIPLFVGLGISSGLLSLIAPTVSLAIVVVSFIFFIVFIWLRTKSYAFSDVPFLILLIGSFGFGRTFSVLNIQFGGIPLFITEGVLVATLILIFLRRRTINVFKVAPKSFSFALVIYSLIGLFYIFLGYQQWGMIALRDIVFCVYPLFLFITIVTFRNGKRLRQILSVMVPVSFVSIIVGVYRLMIKMQFSSGFEIINQFLQTKSFNLVLYYGFIMIFCVAFFPFAKKKRFLLSFLLSLSVVLIFLFKVRAAWIASVVAVLFLTAILGKHVPRTFLRISPLLFLAIIFAFVIQPDLAKNMARGIILEAKSLFDWQMFSTGNIGWRLEVWRQTLQYGLESPLAGMGFGVQPVFTVAGRIFHYPQGFLPGLEVHSPHNHILAIFFKMGLIGVFLFAFINLRVFFYGLRYIRSCRSEFNKWFLIACLGSLVYWHSNAFFFDVIESPPTSIFLWIILGLILSVIYIDKKNENPHLS